MEKLAKRDQILYIRIKKENLEWIESQMKVLGYPKTRGKSVFLDDLISSVRKENKSVCA